MSYARAGMGRAAGEGLNDLARMLWEMNAQKRQEAERSAARSDEMDFRRQTHEDTLAEQRANRELQERMQRDQARRGGVELQTGLMERGFDLMPSPAPAAELVSRGSSIGAAVMDANRTPHPTPEATPPSVGATILRTNRRPSPDPTPFEIRGFDPERSSAAVLQEARDRRAADEAGAQRGWQAGESAADRENRLEIARIQAAANRSGAGGQRTTPSAQAGAVATGMIQRHGSVEAAIQEAQRRPPSPARDEILEALFSIRAGQGRNAPPIYGGSADTAERRLRQLEGLSEGGG